VIKDLFLIRPLKVSQLLKGSLALLMFAGVPVLIRAQAVSEIITNYNGYWKTGTTAVSPVKPDNHHNLLSFSYNGTRISTGVNDALLTSHGDVFTAGNYQALPLQNINGTPTGNTKIGLGAMVDGVANGSGATAPSRSLGQYLNDGTNGLDMGTCIANLPAGTMFMSTSNIQSSKIGDGIPDMLITQVADPSGAFLDSYEFTDINGARIGNSLDIVLNNITPVGQWMADFYEATGSTIIGPSFIQTQRDLRLWAADFSSFGLNASNIANVAYFKITLNGNSDIAFVAYNTTTITVQQVLALPANLTRLTRTLPAAEINTLSLYPNPAVNTLNLVHPSSSSNDKIFIYNTSGVLIKQFTPASGNTKSSINISSLGRGSYQAVFIGVEKRFTQKFLIN
jgi:hypothetical protein